MALKINHLETDEHYNISPINICQEKYFLLLYPSKCIISCKGAQPGKIEILGHSVRPKTQRLAGTCPVPSRRDGQGGSLRKDNVSHQRDFGRSWCRSLARFIGE